MIDSPTSRRTPAYLTATAIVLVLLGVYVGGYFWLGMYSETSELGFGGPLDTVIHERYFNYMITNCLRGSWRVIARWLGVNAAFVVKQ